MIYIVHGENSAQSRALILNQQTKLGIETRIELNAEDIQPTQLYEMAISGDLFGNLPFIVLDVTSLNKQASENLFDVLKKIPQDTTVVLFSQKNLPKSNLLLVGTTEIGAKVITSIKTSESDIFKFVDNLFYKDRAKTYRELQKLLDEGADPFHIMSMILYGLRTVAVCVYNSPSSSELKPFVRSKAQSQAKNFNTGNIPELFLALYELDKKIKIGELNPDLAVTIAIEKVLIS